jgi:hypothetical protein
MTSKPPGKKMSTAPPGRRSKPPPKKRVSEPPLRRVAVVRNPSTLKLRPVTIEAAPEAHEWRAIDGGPAATVCHLWCARCGTLWEVADPHDPTRTNAYFVVGQALDKDGQSRPRGGLSSEPPCAAVPARS